MAPSGLDYGALTTFPLAGLPAGLTLGARPESTPELWAVNLPGAGAGSLAVLGALATLEHWDRRGNGGQLCPGEDQTFTVWKPHLLAV